MNEKPRYPTWDDKICCQHCNKVVPQPFFVVKHFGHMTQQFAFCDEACANEFYLNRLRKEGL